MRIGLNVISAILVLIGAVWALQGLNLIGGSFMTGQTRWLVIGIICDYRRFRIDLGEPPAPLNCSHCERSRRFANTLAVAADFR
jgi:hypothetical protein